MVTTLSQTPLTQVRYLAYLIQISFPCSHSKQLTKQSLLIMKMALDHHRHIPTMVKVLIIFRNAHQTGQHIRSASSCMQLIAFNKQYKILLESKINKLSRINSSCSIWSMKASTMESKQFQLQAQKNKRRLQRNRIPISFVFTLAEPMARSIVLI